MPASRESPESELINYGSVHTYSLNAGVINLDITALDRRSNQVYSRNHTHDQSFCHLGSLECEGYHGATLPHHLIQRINGSQALEEERHHSLTLPPPSVPPLSLSPQSVPVEVADSPVEELDDANDRTQHPIIGHQSTVLEIEGEPLETTDETPRMTRKVDHRKDGFDLVDCGESQGQIRSLDFFHPGRVINPYSGKNDELDGRTLIVLSTTYAGFVECVALCRHSDHNGDEKAIFYDTHAAVYQTGSTPPTRYERDKNEAIEVKLNNDSFTMRDSCQVNFEQTWSLRFKFPVVDVGHVRKDQRRTLLETHLRVQTDLFNHAIREWGYGAELKAPRA